MSLYRRQFRRLAVLDEAIRAGRYPNCRSFAQGWGVNRRTIARDIELLRESGAPIEFDPIRNGYAYTDPSWTLPRIGLSEGELFHLLLAERMAAQYRGTPLARTLGRIFEKISARLTDPVHLDPSIVSEQISFHPAPSRPIDEEVWTAVLRALRGSLVLEIEYHRPDWPENADMSIEPVHLASLAGEWHIVARYQGQQDLRQFALSRIRSAKVTRTRFDPPEFDAEVFFRGRFSRFVDSEGRSHHVEIRFTPTAAPWVLEREWHPDQRVRRHRDGGITLTFPAPDLDEVKRWVLRWGGEAEVLRPAPLVTALREEVERLVKSVRDARRGTQ